MCALILILISYSEVYLLIFSPNRQQMMISRILYNHRVSDLLVVDEFACLLFEGHEMFATFQRQIGAD
jgi:hypothetical protein